MTKSPVWHPFTQHAVQPEPTLISKGEGAWLEAADGRRIFDAISSSVSSLATFSMFF